MMRMIIVYMYECAYIFIYNVNVDFYVIDMDP